MGALAIEAGKAGINTAQGVVGTGLGMLTAKWADQRQIKQQQKLQNMQIAGSQEMGKFNQGLALDTWEKTGYEAQRKQMEKAGINPGLMYGGAGAGGTTQSAPGQVTGGTAPQGGNEIGMGIQTAMAMEMQKAQIKLAETQAEKNKAEADKTKGVDTSETLERIEQIKANTANAKLLGEIQGYERDMKRIETEVKTDTQEDTTKSIKYATQRAEQEVLHAATQNKINIATAEEVIKQIKLNSIEQGIRIEAGKKGLIKTDAEINAIQKSISKMGAEIGKMSNDVLSRWRELDQRKQEIEIKKILMDLQTDVTNFNTSTPEQIKQWTEIITGFIPLIGKRR